MVVRHTEQGFTIAEMIVTLVVMSVFMGLLFQMYMAGISQQTAVARRAAANDIAITNLKKIVARTSSLLSSSGVTCKSSNDMTSGSYTGGSTITFTGESLTGTGLPPSPTTSQTLKASYPRGCGSTMPIMIESKVTYGSDSVTHVSYVD